MGEAVESEELTHEKFIIAEQWERFGKEGGIILACRDLFKIKRDIK